MKTQIKYKYYVFVAENYTLIGSETDDIDEIEEYVSRYATINEVKRFKFYNDDLIGKVFVLSHGNYLYKGNGEFERLIARIPLTQRPNCKPYRISNLPERPEDDNPYERLLYSNGVFAPLVDFLEKHFSEDYDEVMDEMMFMGHESIGGRKDLYLYKNSTTKQYIAFDEYGLVQWCSDHALFPLVMESFK